MNPDCCCPAECAEPCRPDRYCDDPGCMCYRLWAIEIDGLTEATRHLTSEQIHRMMLEALAGE